MFLRRGFTWGFLGRALMVMRILGAFSWACSQWLFLSCLRGFFLGVLLADFLGRALSEFSWACS